MKLQTLLNNLEQIEYYSMQQFWDKDYEGTCPCFYGEKTVDGETIIVHGQCWRVSDHGQDLHVIGTLPMKDKKKIATLVKKSLDAQEWYQPYTIIYEE